MAQTLSDIIGEVRSLTDYDTSVYDEGELNDVVSIAQDEVRADVGDPSLSFHNGSDTFYQDRALVWLGALFAKIRAGEIEGVDLTAGDLDIEALRAVDDGQPVYWLAQYRRRLNQLGGSSGFGSVQVSRTERSYEFETRE